MANDISGNGIASNLLSGTSSSAATKTTKKSGEVGKDEFLKLLVTQLKNQDPLDPMKNEEFAVNLAQFSQLEQLVSINSKLDADTAPTDVASLAAYLGRQVALAGDQLEVSGNDAGLVQINLPRDAADAKLELLGFDGSVIETVDLGALASGRQTVSLTDVEVPNGSYGFRVKATDSQGGAFQPTAYAAGVVSGFVPGPDAVLLMGSRQIKPADVVEMTVASQQ